ncbi:MAG: leucine-rich repeat protein [Acidobacteriota bacterium]|nr:leucine-rich repeat protein [Acidobacteriota bacterium]
MALAIGALGLAPIASVAAEGAAVRGIFTAFGTTQEHRSRAVQPQPLARLSDSGTDRSGSAAVEGLRSRSVIVDFRALSAVREAVKASRPAQLRLNVFSDVDLDVQIDRTADTRYGYSVSGRIDGDPHGAVTLVVHGDILAGAIHTREGTYAIGSRNGVIHTVRETSGDFQCGVDGRPKGAAVGITPESASATKAANEDDGSEVDLLVLFTPAALDVEGSLRRMRARIDLAVAWANDAYAASGVDLRLNLTASVLVGHEESAAKGSAGVRNQWFDLQNMIERGDDLLEEAHALRDRYAADVVHLIVDQPGGGGVGELLKVDEEDPSAFAFSVSNSLSEPLYLVHEVGHVMGLLHDRYEEADSGWRFAEVPLPPYAYGYVNQRTFDRGAAEHSRWRTIMSYDTQCRHEGFSCRQLQRFSNPEQNFPAETGDPLGVRGAGATDAIDGPADAVRGLNDTRTLVAGFRDSATRCGYRLSEARRDVPADGGAYSVEIDAAPSCAWTATAFGEHVEISSEAMGSGSGEVSYRVDANDGPPRLGYVTLAGEMLAIYQSAAVAPAGVCGRTAQVRDAIVKATGSTCDAVSEFDLLDVNLLDLGFQSIGSIRRGDFSGLWNLVDLRLQGNEVASIEDGSFDDLGKLQMLNLAYSGLDGVPEAIGTLRSLTRLNLHGNRIEHVSERAFAGLSELRVLHLSGNGVATLDEGVFSDQRKLTELYLDRNRITDITRETMRGPQDLVRLELSDNPLGEIRPDAFAAIPKLWNLTLRGTQLRTIPSQAIANVESSLDLSDNLMDDLSGTTFPGWSLSGLNLANNALKTLPDGVFAGFTSRACRHGEMELNLSGNPGAPFPLTLELDRVDAGAAAPGPAQAVVRVREGAPWPIAVRVVGTGRSSFTQAVTVENGASESEPFEVTGEELVLLRLAAAPRTPLGYRGVRMALGDALPLFGLEDAELSAGGAPFRLDLAGAFARDGQEPQFSVASGDAGVATADVASGTLTVAPVAAGETTVTVTAGYEDGTTVERTFAVSVGQPRSAATPTVWLFPRASDTDRQGFARVVNRSDEGGEVRITAVDDAGTRYGPVVLSMDRRQTVHFNSEDLASGNAAKGLSAGVGSGQGDWRLSFESDLDIDVLSYVRTTDGFLTSMHDVAPAGPDGLRVVTFNPASNVNQASRLRLVNPGDGDATATITGVDDAGRSPGDGVRVAIPAGESLTLSSHDLESGAGVDGSLGDGQGKWRLEVGSEEPLAVMSLLENRGTGHLTNLSTVPEVSGDGIRRVPLFPSAADALGRQGFVRVVNRSENAGEVTIAAHDESERTYEPLILSVESGETVHFNSNDLELGNAGKGLSGSTGAGTGDWRLTMTSDLEIDVFSYIRTGDGFLTAVHDTVPLADGAYPVATLNPGSNVNQVSSLRLANAGTETAEVTIQGIDDAGNWSREVRLSLPAGAVREFTAATLESGGEGFEGALGEGVGKWRLTVVSDRPLSVISLLESPTGHVTNLSTAPRY